MKKINNIIIITIVLVFFMSVLLYVLGGKVRVGYLDNITLNIDETLMTNDLEYLKQEILETDRLIDNLKTNENVTNYVYDFKIRYYSKIFRNSDIYGVYPIFNNIPSYIKSIRMNENSGSPFGKFYTDSYINVQKIEGVDYTLKVKFNILNILYLILFTLLLIYLLIQNKLIFKFSLKKLICSFFSKSYFSIVVVFVISSILIFVLLPIISNTPVIYDDFILLIKYTAQESLYEVEFRILLLLVSSILLILLEYIHLKNKTNYDKKNNIELSWHFIFIFSALMLYFINITFDNFVIYCIFISLLISIKYNKFSLYFFVTVFIIYYFLLSICTLIDLIYTDFYINNIIIQFTSLIISIIILCKFINSNDSNVKYKWIKLISFIQILIPLLLLKAVLKEQYIYNGKIFTFENSYILYRIIFVSVSLISIFVNILKFKNNSFTSIKNIIGIPTIIAIVIYHNPYMNYYYIMNADWWHLGDEISSFYQTFFVGNKIFVDLYPISGLYGFVTSFINMLSGGNYSEILQSANINYLLFIIIIYFLISKNANTLFAFFISQYFYLFHYNRTFLIIPIVLSLSIPRIINNRGLWLQIWVFGIFLYGLYYASYAYAVLIGTLPFGLIQVYFYIKNKEILKDCKKIYFYISWGIIFLAIILAIPMLLNYMKWVILQSGQTNFVDGTKIFGYNPPVWFLENISSLNLRRMLYYIARIMLPTTVVLVAVHMLVNYLYSQKNKKITEKLHNPFSFLLIFSIIFMFLTSFQTFVREDAERMAARSGHIILILSTVILPIAILFYNKTFSKSYKMKIVSILIFLALLSQGPIYVKNVLFDNNVAVTEDFQLIDYDLQRKYPKLGTGFIHKKNVDLLNTVGDELINITTTNDFIASYNQNIALYPLINRKLFLVEDLLLLQTTDMLQFALNKMNVSPPAVFAKVPFYLYPWLIENNYKISPKNDELLLRYDVFESHYGTPSAINDITNYKYLNDYIPVLPAQFEKEEVAKMMGRSIDKLKKYFTNEYNVVLSNNIEYIKSSNEMIIDIQFGNTVIGKSFDYLYLEFSKETKIYTPFIVYWTLDDNIYKEENSYLINPHNINKYLLPVGYINSWRFNEHNKIRIIITNYYENIKINNLVLYKRDIL